MSQARPVLRAAWTTEMVYPFLGSHAWGGATSGILLGGLPSTPRGRGVEPHRNLIDDAIGEHREGKTN